MTKNSKIFRLRPGKETVPVVENRSEKDTSIFKEQYEESLSIVNDIIEQNERNRNGKLELCNNNIVAFVGQRGMGKTSCMLSVANMLREYDSDRRDHEPYLEKIGGDKLYFLKLIDPSFFDAKHNILELIIGNMYYEFSEELSGKKNTLADRTYYIRDLQESFQKVKHDLIYLNLAPNSALEPLDEELEQLRDLSAGINLAEGIHGLVSSFLKFMGKDILVISIDDIDLNISEGYTMMEQLRKYFILPNVLILMSLNLDQMRTVIQQSTASKFPDLIRLNIMGSMDLSEMSERYLEKVLPLSSRILLPSPDELMEISTELNLPMTLKNPVEGKVKEVAVSGIFYCCGYHFINFGEETSLIVPRNLRALLSLFSLLRTMDGKDRAKTPLLFQDYVFMKWASQLDYPFKVASDKLKRNSDPLSFNRHVINILSELYNESTISELQKSRGVPPFNNIENRKVPVNETFGILSDIMNENNLPSNISFGDVAYLLDYLLKLETGENIRKFIFFIKLLYTFKMHEYSNTDINSFRSLIGGSFYCLSGTTFIGREKQTGMTREIRLIAGEKVMELINYVVNGSKEDANYLVKLKVAEYFMLAISCGMDSNDSDIALINRVPSRLSPSPYYDSRLSEAKYMKFDILAPLFNTIDKKAAYGRFSSKIYDIAKKEESSLVNTLESIAFTDYDDIQQIGNILKQNRDKFVGKDITTLMYNFYHVMGTEWGGCNFSLVDIANTLEGLFSNDDGFGQYFNEIYYSVTLSFEDYFAKFLRTQGNDRAGNTVVRALKEKNRDFFDYIGEDIIRNVFPKNKRFTTEEQKGLLRSLMKKYNYPPFLAEQIKGE
ncbi:MAG: hypothetical protein ACI3Y0_06820 [Prevotella sp.]